MSNSRLFLRPLVAHRSAFLAFAVLVLLVAIAATGWQRASTALLTTDVQYRVGTATAVSTDILSTVDTLGAQYGNASDNAAATTATWNAIPSALTATQKAMDPQLRAVTGAPRYVGRAERGPDRNSTGIPATGTDTGTDTAPAGPQRFTIEANPRLESDARLVSGTWPAANTSVSTSTPVEVVIVDAAAKTLGWKLGQVSTFTLATTEAQPMKLVGTISPRDPTTDYWTLDSARTRAGLNLDNMGNPSYRALVWVDAGSWGGVASALGGNRVDTWFPINQNGLTAQNASSVSASLQKYLASPTPVEDGTSSRVLRSTSGLSIVLADFLAVAGPANALLAVLATGPLGGALIVVVLGVRLLSDQRRTARSLLFARGSSPRRLRTTAAAEIALVSVPAAVVGFVLTSLLIPGPMAVLPVVSAIVLGVGPAALAAATAVDRSGRDRGIRWARPVVETLVIVAALLASVVMLTRGLGEESGTFAIDPLVTATPLLLVLAASVVVLRVYPVVLGAARRAIRRGTGVLSFVGSGIATRAAVGGTWIIIAIVTSVSVMALSAVTVRTEASGISTAAIGSVGADLSLSGTEITADQLAKVQALNGVARTSTIGFAAQVDAGSTGRVDLYLVDPAGVAALQSTLSPAQRPLGALDNSGGADAAAPNALTYGTTHSQAGVQLQLGASEPLTVDLVGVDPPPFSFMRGGSWVLMDRGLVPEGSTLEPRTVAVLVQLSPGASASRVADGLRAIGGDADVVESAASTATTVRSSPIVGGVEQAGLVAILLGALAAIATLVLTLIAAAPARAARVRVLRSLGFSFRQQVGIVVWELGPVALVGTVVSIALGVGLAWLLLHAIDLGPFTGGIVPPPVVIDPLALLAIGVAFLIAVGVACAVTAVTILRRAARRSAPRRSALRRSAPRRSALRRSAPRRPPVKGTP